ncbi:MAG: hypothetical protein ABSF25_16350 [Bryobacteraceae bacterium]
MAKPRPDDGVEPVDDLDRAGEQFVGDVPDPGRAILQDRGSFRFAETPSRGLAQNPLGKLGPLRWIGGGAALDGGRIGDRALIAYGSAVRIAGFRTPHRAEFDFAGLGRSIRLFAGAATGRVREYDGP